MMKMSEETTTDPLAIIKVTFEKMPIEMRVVLDILSFMLVSVTIFMYLYVINHIIEKVKQKRNYDSNYVNLTN